ncbi:MAG: endolytic transglycosylase MltG, partial [Bacteroidales bacterium]|nr:endolytic transglycosylase MltG [Bacteroidales bacterium]
MTSRAKKILIIILSVLFVVLIAGGYFGYRIYRYVYAPNVIVKSENYFLKIPTGSDFEDVVTLLSEKKLLNDVVSFRWVADKKNYGSRVKPGRYQLKNGMSNNELINLLRSGAQTP